MLGLGRALVPVAVIPASGQVEVPAAELGHPCAGGVGSGLGDAGHGPKEVEEVAGVPAIALRTVGSNAHPREELRALRFIDQVEEDRGHPAFAVVLMSFDPWMMVSVGDRALVDVETHQACAAFDGEVHGRILHARLPCQHQGDREGHARGVHHAVAVKASVGPGELVPPRAYGALAAGRFQCEAFQPRHERCITRCQLVLRQQQHDVAEIPCRHVVGLVLRSPRDLPPDQRKMVGVAAGQQREGIEGSGDGIDPSGVGGILHPLGQGSAPCFEDSFGLQTVKRGGGAVRSQDGEFQGYLFGTARAPSGQGELALSRLGLGQCQGLAEFGAWVVGKWLAAHAENHVSDRQNTFGRRTLFNPCDGDLTGIGSDQLVAEDPTSQTRGPQIPVVLGALGDLIPLGEIGDLQFATLARRNEGRRQYEKRGQCDGLQQGFHRGGVAGPWMPRWMMSSERTA